MSIEKVDWVKKQILADAQQGPAALIPNQIVKILQNGGHPKDAQDILSIQEVLSQLGHNPGELDGFFKKKKAVTSLTMRALSDFQKANGLAVDGLPGRLTLTRMLGLLEQQVKKPTEKGQTTVSNAVVLNPHSSVISVTEKSTFQTNIDGLKGAASMLRWGSLFSDQGQENMRGMINKPKDDLHHGKDAKTAILIPGFLCNQGVMRQLGDQLSKSMNVVYPDIGALEQSYKSLPELADSIANYVINLENKGLLEKDGNYTIIGHSLGGSLALLVTSKLRARHIIQVSTPNRAPDISKVSGLGYIPALFNLRSIESGYENIKPISPIGRLTSIIPRGDVFIGTDVQGFGKIPGNIRVNRSDNLIVNGGHIDPILTKAGIQSIVDSANQKD